MSSISITRLALALLLLLSIAVGGGRCQFAGISLQMYVDELPKIPTIYGYTMISGVPAPAKLVVGMYETTWKFHRDLPPTPIFAYGTSAATATFPGPTIEAIQNVATYVTWENHLPNAHILPWDPTVPTAIPKSGGVPAVVHLHGGVHEPHSDGSAFAWFTAGFKEKGPAWTTPTYSYPNVQQPGNLWYHDHALGLTRANLLAGLLAPYVIRNPSMEAALKLPSGPEFDRHLVIADRSFNTDGSIYMNSTGNNPAVHPQWRPEYFGDAITVNGKAWPFLKVQQRKYRFRILNASNARYLRLSLSNGRPFTVIGSDTSYLTFPASTNSVLLSPAEIFDVIVDFSGLGAAVEVEMTNDAPYPFPVGTPTDLLCSKVMKFIVLPGAPNPPDYSSVPPVLSVLPPASVLEATVKRYIVMYEYLQSATAQPTHMYINGRRLEDPATETPRSGSTEVWEVINLTGDNHPLHLHLAMFQAVRAQQLVNLTAFADCMTQLNDAAKCNVGAHAAGPVVVSTPAAERTWKNVVKIEPGYMTTVVVKFNLVQYNAPYPFDATAAPGYVYHCHILDHEDNAMIRPLTILP